MKIYLTRFWAVMLFIALATGFAYAGRNGSGTYTAPSGSWNPAVASAEATASDWNDLLDDIEAALTASIAVDGQTVPTANLPMATYRHTNVGDASARTQYLTAKQYQDGEVVYLTSVSGTDTITATAPLSVSAYAAGQRFVFKAAGTNTGATTLNLNSIGAKAIQKSLVALAAGDITQNDIVEVVYDGTQFQMISPARTPVLQSGTLTDGDVLFYSGGLQRLALGNNTQFLSVQSGALQYTSISDFTQASASSSDWVSFEDSDGAIKYTSAQDLVESGLPSQSGNSGKFLTTDGTDLSFGTALTYGEGAEITITTSSTVTEPHGLGHVPKIFGLKLICKTANLGYSVGDEVSMTMVESNSASNNGFSLYADATNIGVVFSAGIMLISKTTNVHAQITTGSWKIVFWYID